MSPFQGVDAQKFISIAKIASASYIKASHQQNLNAFLQELPVSKNGSIPDKEIVLPLAFQRELFLPPELSLGASRV